jgi:hypothetical protein
MNKKLKYAAFIAVIIVTGEVGVRAFGMVDFPVYNIDKEIGYIAKENQQGVFLNRNDWYFNDKSMPIQKKWNAGDHLNILIIGNSIVMGGNVFRQQERLTTRLQDHLGKYPVVWPIAIGGWTEINEMVYLDRHPEIASKANYVVWECMAGGLSRATPWRGEYVFPTHRPVYATWYVLRRYVLPRLLPFFRGNELPVTGETDATNVQHFDSHVDALVRATRRSHGGIIWLYPSAAQLIDARNQREWLPERPQILKVADKYGLRVVDISTHREWDMSLYDADGLHPTVEGNEVLASILSSEIARDLK